MNTNINNQQILFNACKKALKDRLDLSVKDDDLFNVINQISASDPSRSNKETLRLILDHYGGNPNKDAEKTLETAVQELEMIRSQPVIVSSPPTPPTPSSIAPSNPSSMIPPINSNHPIHPIHPIPPLTSSLKNAQNAQNATMVANKPSPNYFNISVPPKPKKYLKTFLINSGKRNWVDDPLRSRFVYEFPKDTSLLPRILSFPTTLINTVRDTSIIILKITNTNGKLEEFHFYPIDTDKQVWKTIEGITPYILGLRDNISTVGLYDDGDYLLRIGQDNVEKIKSFERLDDIMCKIELSCFPSSFVLICNDSIYYFEWLRDDLYEYYEPITFDIVNTPHNIMLRNQQFSILCSYV